MTVHTTIAVQPRHRHRRIAVSTAAVAAAILAAAAVAVTTGAHGKAASNTQQPISAQPALSNSAAMSTIMALTPERLAAGAFDSRYALPAKQIGPHDGVGARFDEPRDAALHGGDHVADVRAARGRSRRVAVEATGERGTRLVSSPSRFALSVYRRRPRHESHADLPASARNAHRRLSGRGRSRSGRDERRLPGRGSSSEASRRPQAADAHARRGRTLPRAVPVGIGARRLARPRERDPDLRGRRGRRPALHRNAVRRGIGSESAARRRPTLQRGGRRRRRSRSAVLSTPPTSVAWCTAT